LVDLANAGDVAGFEGLYHRYKQWVANLAFRFTGDRDLALDVLQETFSYLLRKFPGFALTAQMTTFLYPAVRNLSVVAKRKVRRLNLVSEPPEPAGGEEEDAERAQARSRVELGRVMAGLPEGQREALLLRFVDGMSLEEVAQALEVPVGTVKSRLHLGLKALREDPATRKYFEA
jgi:RNA polymerase sigma-70 factor (ECF subfamily)